MSTANAKAQQKMHPLDDFVKQIQVSKCSNLLQTKKPLNRKPNDLKPGAENLFILTQASWPRSSISATKKLRTQECNQTSIWH